MSKNVIIETLVFPFDTLAVLSQTEVNALCEQTPPPLAELFRRCALAVLSSGADIDDPRALFARYPDFRVDLEQRDKGLCLKLHNAPATAFVDGGMIRGIREQLFAVLRDLIYVHQASASADNIDFAGGSDITDKVFRILRNAAVMHGSTQRPLAVCWGGHAINRSEYDYTKAVGYALGLRGFDICTGCGPGAMKGPMKGATIAHAKQRIRDGRYLGITEPGIIAAEAPNAIVNELVVMPDMEKRLEAFVRLAHAIVIFPGGVGTAEELLYLLGLLAHTDNADQHLPIILTGPAGSADYFAALDGFIRSSLGDAMTERYRIIIDDPVQIGSELAAATQKFMHQRDTADDARYFNWRLKIDPAFQQPFAATHATMRELELSPALPPAELAANLRRAFSGIVAGNVKDDGIREVERQGPFELHGDAMLVNALDLLLRRFVEQGRMKLDGRAYNPCYTLVS